MTDRLTEPEEQREARVLHLHDGPEGCDAPEIHFPTGGTMRLYSDQDYREMLEAVLDPSASLVDRRNAVIVLRAHLADALEGAEQEVTPTETT